MSYWCAATVVGQPAFGDGFVASRITTGTHHLPTIRGINTTIGIGQEGDARVATCRR